MAPDGSCQLPGSGGGGGSDRFGKGTVNEGIVMPPGASTCGVVMPGDGRDGAGDVGGDDPPPDEGGDDPPVGGEDGDGGLEADGGFP